MALHACEIRLTAAPVEEVLARLEHVVFLLVAERDVHLHPVRPGCDVERQGLHVRPAAAPGAYRPFHDVGAIESLQLDHAGQQPRLEVLHLIGIGKVARQPGGRAFELAGPHAEVALFQRRALGAALLVEQGLALLDPQFPRIVLGQHLAPDPERVVRLRQHRRRTPRREACEQNRGNSAAHCRHILLLLLSSDRLALRMPGSQSLRQCACRPCCPPRSRRSCRLLSPP